MAFRFVHTADLHLDSPLRSLSLRNEALAELIGDATRKALTAIVDLCLEERVDALLIAGDLYDGEQTSMKTARFLAAEMGRLDQAGIRTFKIRGNHDAMSRITRELVLPPSVTVFGDKADVVVLSHSGGHIAVHGLSFAKPHAPESLLPKYRPPLSDAVNIGLMHTSLSGSLRHDPYAPCTVEDLHASGFDYWALGHIHQRMAPAGKAAVIMPGMPQGRDINEAGAKTVSLVTVADDGSIHIEERLTSIAEFGRVALDITGIEDWRSLAQSITATLEAARSSALSEHFVARLKLTGDSGLRFRIRRDLDLLTEEAAARAESIGKTWVEKIELDLTPRTISQGGSADPVEELSALMQGEIMQGHAFREDVREMVRELIDDLPQESRRLAGDSAADFDVFLDRLMQESGEDIIARLKSGSGEDS